MRIVFCSLWLMLVVTFLLTGVVQAQQVDLTNNGTRFEATTPYYAFVLSSNPVRIESIAWDWQGQGDHKPLVCGTYPGTPWASTLFVGISNYTDTLAGNARHMQWEAESHTLTLRDIALTDGLTADWVFLFDKKSITHTITWSVAQPLAVKNLGHQWVGGAALNVRGNVLTGDVAGFSPQAYMGPSDGLGTGMEITLKSPGISAAGVYNHPLGIVFQNFGITSKGGALPVGKSAGGAWTLSATVLPAGKDLNSFAEFHHPGHYMKDHHIEKVGDTYHLIYNIGTDNLLGWIHEGQEDSFGHAVSKDFIEWEILEPVMHKIPGGWEGATISAPCILPLNGRYMMAYTGFASDPKGHEQMGIAWSDDLLSWERDPHNPVMSARELTTHKVDMVGASSFRDPHVIPYQDGYVAYNTIQYGAERRDARGRPLGAVSITFSKDLINWEDGGIAYEPMRGIPESACVWKQGDWYYMITSIAGATMRRSNDPLSNAWEELPWRVPTPGYYAAYEVLVDGDRTILSAFFHKQPLNFMQFWEIEYDANGIPFVAGCPEL